MLAANSLAGLVKLMELRFILTKCGYSSTPQVILWSWQSEEMLLQHCTEVITGMLICGPKQPWSYSLFEIFQRKQNPLSPNKLGYYLFIFAFLHTQQSVWV